MRAAGRSRRTLGADANRAGARRHKRRRSHVHRSFQMAGQYGTPTWREIVANLRSLRPLRRPLAAPGDRHRVGFSRDRLIMTVQRAGAVALRGNYREYTHAMVRQDAQGSPRTPLPMSAAGRRVARKTYGPYEVLGGILRN
jgi:hypothetical protein